MAEGNAQRKVLIAMDGSKHATGAFEWFVKNMYKDSDTVIMVYCAESGDNLIQFSQLENPSVIPTMIAEHDKEVQKVLQTIDDIAKKHKVEHTVERLHQPAGESIVKAARDHKADIIVCGTRGLGVIRRTIMGSVSDYIVHHSHVPVLVCKLEDVTSE
ncbi:universal stress protein Sll1388-like [Mercenaria mercenaria]|uniref:universal stress protein Sll1388-like n=1 Tax=Mercenaria mercenaria TaxID=6596 RepID=UPI00234EAA86|nr:universal stress protein Sll1388-like [Mercenaria mercenaria]